ncbi:hypothetical protein TWF696_001344 [Orbilia brochopaga]|uniref:Prolyl 4-hydroxylase alpha subunit Fe(2+) 2OG dioxygenase domain-containing protein n=1 Tax=Orbilia brochopaga TaxID=3140254 RepID=A0AAV9UCE2_9PEZI
MDEFMRELDNPSSDSWEDEDEDDVMDTDDDTPEFKFKREETGEVDPALELELYNMIQKSSSHYEGSFAISSHYSAAPNPGLKIAGLGDSVLSLPITPNAASALIKLGDVSPFGKGEQTLIDPKVRRSRQLDPSSVQCENPAFSEWLNCQVLPEMSKALGISSDMEPKLNLYKLLIYEKGDHFKAHRDSPKEDGMIGTLVVVLPSVFEGGVITLTHGDETKTFDFAPSGKYNTHVAAWYSDVKHAVDEIKSGYRIALVYNLIVGRGSISVKDTTVNPDILDVLRRFRETTEPVAFVLNNKYSLSQRRQGFKGKDRYIVSNLTTAINIVGGIALCCGDLGFRITNEEDFDEDSEELEDIEEEDDEDVEYDEDDDSIHLNRIRGNAKAKNSYPPDFSRLRGGSSLSLSNLEHIAGTYRHFTGDKSWDGKMYSLGPELNDLKPFNLEEEETGNEGVVYHSWYQTSCIVLWPTSEARSIIEQTADPTLPWDDFLNIVTKRTPPQDNAKLKNEIEYTKVQLLLERCICNPPADDQIKQAGMLVYAKLRSLPSDYVFEIGEKELLRYANLVSLRTKIQFVADILRPKHSRAGLLSLLRLKRLFPKDIQFSFNRTINELLGSPQVALDPELLQEFLEVYEESSPQMLRQFLQSAFRAHPNASILHDLYTRVAGNSPKNTRIREVLSQALLYEFHEVILEGINDRFTTAYQKMNADLLEIPYDLENKKYHGMGLYGEATDNAWISIQDKLSHYFDYLKELPAPHRTRLLSLLYESLKLPKRDPRGYKDIGVRYVCDIHLNVASDIIAGFSSNTALKRIAGAAALRESVINAALAMYPVNKPDRPSYYLPAHISAACSNGSSCSVCGVLNQFLQSDTEYEFEVNVSGNEHTEHYRLLERELNPRTYGVTPALYMTYKHHPALSVRYDRPFYNDRGKFRVAKKAWREYRELRAKYDENITRRKELFGRIGEEMDSQYRIKREVDRNHDIPDMQLD